MFELSSIPLHNDNGTSMSLSQLFYHLSKILAKEAAWKFVKVNKFDLVTLHPGYVIGLMLQPILYVTSEGMPNFFKNGMLM